MIVNNVNTKLSNIVKYEIRDKNSIYHSPKSSKCVYPLAYAREFTVYKGFWGSLP